MSRNASVPKSSLAAKTPRAKAVMGYRACARSGAAVDLQTLVEIEPDRLHQRLDLAVEEVVGAGHDFLLDDDALLRLELVDQAGDVLVRDDRVLVAVDDQPGRGAGRQERKVVEVG